MVVGDRPARKAQPRAGPALALHDRSVLGADRRRLRRPGLQRRLLALPGAHQLVAVPRRDQGGRHLPSVPPRRSAGRRAVQRRPEDQLLRGGVSVGAVSILTGAAMSPRSSAACGSTPPTPVAETRPWPAGPGPGRLPDRRGSAASTEVTGEEARRALQLERGYAHVTARVGMQRLVVEAKASNNASADRRGMCSSSHCIANSTGTVMRRATRPGFRRPARPKTAALIRGSAAVNGTPIAVPNFSPRTRPAPHTDTVSSWRASSVACHSGTARSRVGCCNGRRTGRSARLPPSVP